MRPFALALITAVLSPACLSDDSSDDDPIPAVTFQIDTPDRDVTIIPGGSVGFSSTPAGGAGSYKTLWSFEGGSPESSELEDPGLVQFDTLGSYEVSATASNGYTRAADSVTVNVKAIAATIDHPGVITMCQGESINFQSSFASTNGVIRHEWDFGDGVFYQLGWWWTTQRTFTEVGTFEIRYRATAYGGASDTDTITVVVKPKIDLLFVSPPTPDLWQGGASVEFTVLANYSDGSVVDVTSEATLTSSDPDRVSMDGTVATAATGISPDTVTVTATYDHCASPGLGTAQITTVPPWTRFSKGQINARWALTKPGATAISYEVPPVAGVGDNAFEGVLNHDLIRDGIKMTNMYRWLAGMPPVVESPEATRVEFQKGSHVLAMLIYQHLWDYYVHTPSPHHPPRPTGASAEYVTNVYIPGSDACAESNVYRGINNRTAAWTPAQTVHGYMDDYGSNNYWAMGHRRAILHPKLRSTTFGAFWLYDEWSTIDWGSAMHMADKTAPEPAWNSFAFPSEGYYPKQLFVDPADGERIWWSFSVNPRFYDLDDHTSVSVTRESDGYVFPENTRLLSGRSSGPAVAFTPQQSSPGVTYKVTVSNILWLVNNTYVDYEFRVEFFNAD